MKLGFIPSGYRMQATGVLTGLTTISNETLVVAFVAGIAGMLALETRASSGVGVAISVTTIPAVGYFGVAVGLGELDRAAGALGVLGANVAMSSSVWRTHAGGRRRRKMEVRRW